MQITYGDIYSQEELPLAEIFEEYGFKKLKINKPDVSDDDNYKYYKQYIVEYDLGEIPEDLEERVTKFPQALCDSIIYNYTATEIRALRDELLAQSDKYMIFDRLGLGDSTTFVSFLAKLKSVLTGDIANYRQALRDITKQDGFPYNVKWPDKPDDIK